MKLSQKQKKRMAKLAKGNAASKPLTIFFCLPGATFTQGFMQSWIGLMADERTRSLKKRISLYHDSNVIICRNAILQKKGDKPLRRDMKPFGGEPYDYMCWIDSDTVFTPDDFYKLLYVNREIVTGLVPINAEGIGACGMINGYNPTKYLRLPEVSKEEKKLLEIDFCGFAFLLIKQGVFESMEYPWFRFRTIDVNDHMVVPSEDFEWCIRAKELGWNIFAHPQVRIGHEKQIILKS